MIVTQKVNIKERRGTMNRAHRRSGNNIEKAQFIVPLQYDCN